MPTILQKKHLWPPQPSENLSFNRENEIIEVMNFPWTPKALPSRHRHFPMLLRTYRGGSPLLTTSEPTTSQGNFHQRLQHQPWHKTLQHTPGSSRGIYWHTSSIIIACIVSIDHCSNQNLLCFAWAILWVFEHPHRAAFTSSPKESLKAPTSQIGWGWLV